MNLAAEGLHPHRALGALAGIQVRTAVGRSSTVQVLDRLFEGVVVSDFREPVSFSLRFSCIQRIFRNVGRLAFTFLCSLLLL